MTTRIATCRACEGSELTEAFRLPGLDPWVFCGDEEGADGCGLLQRATSLADAPPRPQPTPSWTEAHRLRAATSQVLEMMTTRDGRALDLRCGSGTLLSALPRWVTPVGMDPALPATGPQDWGEGIAEDFVSEAGQAALDAAGHDRFDVISMIGVLEETEDPLALLLRAKERLASDGVILIETPYAALALTRALASAFHEEARAVYMLSVLERIARACDLKIVRGLMSEASGGSIRLFLTHADYEGHDYAPWTAELARLWDEEAALALHGRQPYRAFAARCATRAAEAEGVASAMRGAYEHAYVLTGGPRVAAALRSVGLDGNLVTAAIGEAPLRLDGGQVASITEDEARAAPADVLIAPAWRRREALERWHDFIEAGGRLLFIEPELQVVDADNYATELGRALAVTDGPGSVESLRAALSAMRRPALHLVAERRA